MIRKPVLEMLQSRIETNDRATLLWIRWLFFLVLTFLFLYTFDEAANTTRIVWKASLLSFYAVSNAALMWMTRKEFHLERWGIPIFVMDVVLVSATLFMTAGPDTDLYVMCFLIIYLSTLGRNIRDAVPLTAVACLIYLLLLYRRNPSLDWMDPTLLLRFPFFLVLALFTSYLSEQAEQQRRRLERMKDIQATLARELQKAMTDLRDKQNALLQAEKMSAMGHMAGALAHEIRNPLSVIIGYVNDLLDGRALDETFRKPLEAVKRSAERCQELMDNLLRFARQPKQIETFKVKDALQESMTLVRMSAKMTRVQCNLDARADPLLSGRRSEFQQIFINLMSNALDAMPEGGTLNVILEEEMAGGRTLMKILVKDTGSGIPPEAREHIFEPFFTTKAPGKGTGLGLSIVRDIVQTYHGVLTVESEIHKGTTFIIRLPVAQP